MKYLKKFEEMNDMPEVGDYVLMHFKSRFENESYINFINNNIGKVVNIIRYGGKDSELDGYYYDFVISYDNIPERLKRAFNKGEDGTYRIKLRGENVIDYDSDKKNILMRIDSDKFNL